MEMRGLALKLVPRTIRSYWEGVNEKVIQKQLMTDVQKPSQTPAYGFRWRGLRNPSVHFDENQRRLILNYRQAFLTYAVYLTNAKHATSDAVSVLNRMEYVIPRSNILLDYRSKSDISQLYGIGGDTVHAREYAAEIATELSRFMTSPMSEPLNQYNPLVVLAQAHEMLGDYDKAIAAMNRLGEVYSSTQGVSAFAQQRVSELTAKKMR